MDFTINLLAFQGRTVIMVVIARSSNQHILEHYLAILQQVKLLSFSQPWFTKSMVTSKSIISDRDPIFMKKKLENPILVTWNKTFDEYSISSAN